MRATSAIVAQVGSVDLHGKSSCHAGKISDVAVVSTNRLPQIRLIDQPPPVANSSAA